MFMKKKHTFLRNCAKQKVFKNGLSMVDGGDCGMFIFLLVGCIFLSRRSVQTLYIRIYTVMRELLSAAAYIFATYNHNVQICGAKILMDRLTPKVFIFLFIVGCRCRRDMLHVCKCAMWVPREYSRVVGSNSSYIFSS